MGLLYLFLPAMLALGGITSFEDIKYRKIRNFYVLLALVASIIVNAVGIAFKMLTFMDVVYVLINGLLALLIGFFLWHYRIWSAGDAKLMFAYAMLIPLATYRHTVASVFPSLVLITNTFIIGLMVVLINLLFRARTLIGNIKLPMADLWQRVAPLFAVHWIMQAILGLAGIHNVAAVVAASFALLVTAQKLPVKTIYLWVCVSILRIVLDESVWSVTFWVYFLAIFALWTLFRLALIDAGNDLFRKRVKQPKPGMMLAEDAGKLAKGSVLTEQDISKLKGAVWIQERLPFAPIILAGALGTIIFGGNILIVLDILF